eukprot:5903919-Pleurochrysis_carterae.AAC.5
MSTALRAVSPEAVEPPVALVVGMEEDQVSDHAKLVQLADARLEMLPEGQTEAAVVPLRRRRALKGVHTRRGLLVVEDVPLWKDGHAQLVERAAAACDECAGTEMKGEKSRCDRRTDGRRYRGAGLDRKKASKGQWCACLKSAHAHVCVRGRSQSSARLLE